MSFGRLQSFLAVAAGILLSCFQLSAQYNDLCYAMAGDMESSSYVSSEKARTDGAVERYGKHFYSENVRLQEADLIALLEGTSYSYQDVVKYRRGFDAGKGLLIGSGIVTLSGSVVMMLSVVGIASATFALGEGKVDTSSGGYPGADDLPLEFQYLAKYDMLSKVGAAVFFTGLAGLIAGTTVFCVYKARLNKVENAINASPAQSVNLSFGTQMHGIGFALNF